MTQQNFQSTEIPINHTEIYAGDCLNLIPKLPDYSVDIVITSPPYWGQRESTGTGTEADPREYINFLRSVFVALFPKIKREGILWLNMGDSYNTPVNWTEKDYKYSTLGADQNGFGPENAAYTKPRYERKAFIDRETSWLKYGNLLMLPQRLLISLVDSNYIFRGEVIWTKKNPDARGPLPKTPQETRTNISLG